MTCTCQILHMDSPDVVDDVISLLKLGVGDPYRLEHIKQTYIQNHKIWITDENYLKRLREKYLIKHTSDVQTDNEIIFENEPDDKETIHCWKCGKKGPLVANFCMICGTSIFEVGLTPSTKESKSKNRLFGKTPKIEGGNGMGIGKKILIGIGILACIVIITAFLLTFSFISFVSDIADGTVEKSKDFQVLEVDETQTLGNMDVVIDKIEFYDEYAKIFLSVKNFGNEESDILRFNSYVKQGSKDFQNIMFQPFGASGTHFDGSDIPSGVIREGIIFVEPWNPDKEFEIILDGSYMPPNPKFGFPETVTFVFNIIPSNNNSKCGAGTVFDSETNSCILGTSKTVSTDTNSKCGPGTIFDSKSNSCIAG